MAAGRLPFPGTKYGPCNEPCSHKDCNETERMSESTCKYCTKKIGYETRFYQLEDNTLVHAACHEEAIESEAEHSAEAKE